ncbi:MAG: ergothioneine biosynthesis protein EgtB [Cyclobacteriaceae bacterium]|nr:MAG: ergothioneine biosynthesis protein EgtB [Cyclobacteriaceae bacterium]
MESTIVNDIDIFQRYQQIRKQTEVICEPLNPEDYVVQPVEQVSPPKWHLAHTTWFFETFLLNNYKPGYQVFHADYNYLFNSYYESIGKRALRTDRGNITRPGVEEVKEYRRYVDEHLLNFLSESSLSAECYKVLEIGIHHEQQHQELLVTDIKYILGHNPVFPAYFDKQPELSGNPLPLEFLEVPEGIYRVGHQGTGFCFDNELSCHQIYLDAFRVMNRLITNSEFQEFISAGGYQKFQYWLMEGWEWVKSNDIKAPLYWHYINDDWHAYNLRGLESLDPNAPVTHISFYEADAFARWKGLRLPTEFEWEVACKMHQPEASTAAGFLEDGNFNPGASRNGNLQFLGDAWEWTGSPYRPYPGFDQTEGALGEYNGKFMINQMVLRGGSCATARNHIRHTYRNFFHPHLRWQFTGIRLAAPTE